ncbi:MAG: hypothetical protein IJC04_08575 [Oscillospiraceae bacterium]|nr:hypothetical protein [Oscillospiraceae bacterium]
MELKVICKRLITQDLDGNITEGEYGADVVGITVPRMYGEHDLSKFSFRLTAVSKANETVAEQVLDMDGITDEIIHLLWEVTSDFTVSSGEVTLVLAGINTENTVQVKFISQPVLINDDARLDFLESPTILEQAYNQIQLEVQRVIDGIENGDITGTAVIEPATEEKLGGVLSGGDIAVDGNGAVTVNSVNGKTVGTDVPEDAVFTDTVYTLPTASTTVKGGVMVDGTTVTADENGVISVIGGSDGTGAAVIAPATESRLGGVLSGGDITVGGNGAVTVNSVNGKTVGTDVPEDAVFTDTVYTLPAASESVLGGVKVDGTTVTIDENGVISAAVNSSDEDYLPLSGGTMTGTLVAQSNTDYTVAQVRNVIISTEEPSGTAPEGTIWYQYEVT